MQLDVGSARPTEAALSGSYAQPLRRVVRSYSSSGMNLVAASSLPGRNPPFSCRAVPRTCEVPIPSARFGVAVTPAAEDAEAELPVLFDAAKPEIQTGPGAPEAEPPPSQSGAIDKAGDTRRPGVSDSASSSTSGRTTRSWAARRSTVWVNVAHPAYRRAAASRAEGYHVALIVALALAPLAVEPASEHGFVSTFLARLGGGGRAPIVERPGPARCPTTIKPGSRVAAVLTCRRSVPLRRTHHERRAAPDAPGPVTAIGLSSPLSAARQDVRGIDTE